MPIYRHRQARPRRLGRSARTLLWACWPVAALGLIRLGLPIEWAAAIFLLGPLAAAAASALVRRMMSDRSRRRPRANIDWSVVAMASSVAIAGFFAALWWPWSLPTSAQPLPAPDAAAASSFSCRVSSVHDGDTLGCTDGTRVRLHAVAAREIDETCSEGHPCPAASAAAARLELVKLTENRTLDCRRTGRSYNRVTAICDNDEGVEINSAMVRSGTTLIWARYHQQQPICGAG